MGGMSLGPLAFSADRAPVAVAIVIALLVAGILGRKTYEDLSSWLVLSLIFAAISGRLAFVLLNWSAFADSPLSILAFWQGGFNAIGAGVGLALVSVLYLRRRQPLWAPAAATLFCAAMAWNITHQLTKGEDSYLPNQLRLMQLDGTPIALEDWQNKPLVINLWASWCPPCRREMPMMADVASSEAEIPILFINQGEGPTTIRRYLAQAGVFIPAIQDPGMQLMTHFEAMGLPATLFIGKDGKLQASHMGEISRARLQAGIEALRP